MIEPGLAVKVSQMLGPLPSLLTAPSIWYAAVLVPNRNPGGNRGMPSAVCPPQAQSVTWPWRSAGEPTDSWIGRPGG